MGTIDEPEGLRSVDAMLAAHQRAEQQLADDRKKEVSARERWKLDERSKHRATPSVDDWERASLATTGSAGSDINGKYFGEGSLADSGSAGRFAQRDTSSDLH